MSFPSADAVGACPGLDAAAALDGGVPFTVGDMGYVDEDGYLFLTGRTAECIISGGVNI